MNCEETLALPAEGAIAQLQFPKERLAILIG